VALGAAAAVIAGGDLTMLISSRLPLQRARQKAVLPTPENLVIENGTNLGEMIARINNIKAAKSYNFFFTADPLTDSSVWTSISSSTCKYTITSLKAGTRVWIKVQAIGPRQQSTWSVTLLSPYVQDRVSKK
jgi:hypothetical protein